MDATTETLPSDLEKARDEKCIPVARAILADMALDLLPEDANVKIDYNPIVLKILQHVLAADLNMTTEAPYVIQLILGVFTGLNQTVQGCTTVPIDDVRYAAIGKKVLAILVSANVRMGTVTPEEVVEDFAVAKMQINQLFVDEKLSMHDVKYIMDNIFDSFNTVSAYYSESMAQSMRKAEEKLFGVEAMSDITIGKIDQVLKS